jgi:hypothetical protein
MLALHVSQVFLVAMGASALFLLVGIMCIIGAATRYGVHDSSAVVLVGCAFALFVGARCAAYIADLASPMRRFS